MKKTIRSTLLICLTLLVCMMMFAACDGVLRLHRPE